MDAALASNGQGARQRAPIPQSLDARCFSSAWRRGGGGLQPAPPTPHAIKAFPAREQPPATWDCREGGSHPRDQ